MPVRAEMLMGTTVTIDAVGTDANAAIGRAFEWFHHVEQVCTRFESSSELCQLVAQPGQPVVVSQLLFEVVRFALHVAHASGGAFDPTVGAAMQQRGFNREHRTGSIAHPLIEASNQVTYRDVAIDAAARTITLTRPLLLDLGGVAKGLAIDLAARELAAFASVAIDAGGDLYLGGLNPEGRPWSIGIRHPRHPGESIASVQVSNRAVCTSGDYERRVAGATSATAHLTATGQAGHDCSDEHHIIDPRTGRSPGGTASVTVIAGSAMLADALATAAFVLGPADGVGFIEHMGGEGLIVTADLEVMQTPGWPDA